MKHVLPWFIRPGGRLASRSSSSLRLRSQYSSWGVGCFLCLSMMAPGSGVEVEGNHKNYSVGS